MGRFLLLNVPADHVDRRTLAVKLHRQGYELVHIATLLGHQSVSTTKRLVTQDPVRLADIMARAI